MISVEYRDHMGDDLAVVNDARQSFDQNFAEWSEVPRTKRGRSDPQLMSDLGDEGHELPFRHAQVKLLCCAPVPIARQLAKHQVGFSWSEVSRRYKTQGLAFHAIDMWRAAPPERRQGSGEPLPARVQAYMQDLQRINDEACLNSYRLALKAGAAPEQARFLLPQSMDISWVWTGSLLGWASLYRKRMHPDAQAETREFAVKMADIVKPLFPHAWTALTADV